jgi:hypothetical protein
MYTRNLTDDMIRERFNSYRDGTITDALLRQRCRVALGELCIGDDGIPGGLRYPTADERHEARRAITKAINEKRP